ncbi:MAG: ABC transporter permease [Chloroflexi bacterium]|nr:ABC transporter permease [Chloroflexota bacterium]
MRNRDIFLAALALLIAWQIAALVLQREILPTPVVVFNALIVQVPRGLAWHFIVSAWRVIASIALAVALATPAGMALGQYPRVNRFFAPVIYLTYPIPKIVLLPIVILFLGIGDASKIAVIFLILFFQVLVVVRDASAALRPELIYSVRSLGAGRRALLRFVYLPATLPAVLTAIRLSIATAIAVLFFTETFATTAGLGYYVITDTFSRVAYPEMYAGVVAMSLLGLVLYFVVDYLERVLCPYLFAK